MGKVKPGMVKPGEVKPGEGGAGGGGAGEAEEWVSVFLNRPGGNREEEK